MATKTQKDVRGVRSDTSAVTPTRIMPTDWENKKLSREQFIAKRKRLKAAEEAANLARAKAMAEFDGAPVTEEAVSEAPATPVHAKPSQVGILRERLAEIEGRLEKDPENAKLIRQKNKLAKELDAAEEAEG